MNYFRMAILAAAVLLSSCSKNDEPAPETPHTPAVTFFAAKVDDQAFHKADIEFTAAKFVTSTKMLQIIGQPTDRKETIEVTLMPFGEKVKTVADWKPGVYDFDPIHITQMEYVASAGYNKWNGNGYDVWTTNWDYVKAGKITIESNSGTHIKGSFSFDAVRKNSDGSYNASSIKKITEGTFDLDIKNL